jgi:hypothetical protein
MLAQKVNDAPPTLALLDVANGEVRHFGPPETAPD